MPAIRGITISVNYGPLLRVTLPLNMRHLTECLVVTSPDDHETQDVACSVPGVSVFETTAFFEFGARMNKGLSLEQGFEHMGRHGWLAIFDADILFPDEMPLEKLRPNTLHGCRRRILEDPSKWSLDLDWRTCPISRDGGPIGFAQIFNCDDPSIRDKRPWYDVSFGHAGGGDAYMMMHWDAAHRVVLPFDVLHLGRSDCNWFGVDEEGRNMMARFCHENGWRGAMRKHGLDAVKRAQKPVHRVEVPGYSKSDFELPFVRRAQRMEGQKP